MEIKIKDVHWINDQPIVKEFIALAKEYYKGIVSFNKNGKIYSAKLDPKKLKINANCREAYFDINRIKNKSSKNCKDIFFLRIIDANSDVNIIKIL